MREVASLLGWRVVACVLLLFVFASAYGQEPGNAPETSPASVEKREEQKQDSKKAEEHPGFGAQLAKETREAAGEESETAQFKQSASVRLLSKLTGGNLQHAYWLAVLLNFLVIVGVVIWAGRKFLPGMFRARTASIQKAMEEARRASDDANRRLSEIESRLAQLGNEISAMKAAGDKDMAAEESRIKAAADEDARKIVQSAEQEIAAAAKAARRDLTAYAADLAIGLAKKQIHVDAGTDASLVRNFVDKLSGAEGKN
jgi:F-type H+-transporting ATPase subunit b